MDVFKHSELFRQWEFEVKPQARQVSAITVAKNIVEWSPTKNLSDPKFAAALALPRGHQQNVCMMLTIAFCVFCIRVMQRDTVMTKTNLF